MTARVTPLDPRAPSCVEAAASEQRLFAHYGLVAESVGCQLPTSGAVVRSTVTGDGEPVVIVPGGSGEAFPYIPLMAELRRYRSIAINRPGGGMSDGIDLTTVDLRALAIEVLDTVMDTLGVDRAPLVCNSMGGLWGFWYALARPERVSAMVQLGCPALALGTSAPVFLRLLSVPAVGNMIARQMQPRSPAEAVRGLKMLGMPAAVAASLPQVVIDTTQAMYSLPTYRAAWTTLGQAVLTLRGAKPRYALGAAELARVSPPVLFIWGERDPFGGLEVGRRACQVVSHARIIETSGGHLPFVEDPPFCASSIEEFLSSDRVPAALSRASEFT